jgi:hypothetical protein
MRLTGSPAAGFYQLYSSTNIAAPGSWTNVSYSLQWSNGQWFIPLPPTSARQQFYQMRGP